MKLTVATLRSILNEIDDDVVLATLDYGNGDFKTFSWIKRLLLLTDKTSGKQYLTINGMGSHFTGTGEQSHLKYAERYWDEDSVLKISVKPDVSGQLPPMFIRWCISKKIEVYSGDAIGITSMSDNGAFPVVSAERLFEIFMEETGGNFR